MKMTANNGNGGQWRNELTKTIIEWNQWQWRMANNNVAAVMANDQMTMPVLTPIIDNDCIDVNDVTMCDYDQYEYY